MTRALPTMTDDEVSHCRQAFAPAAPGATRDPDAGFGALRTPRGCLPLKALDVRARLDGLLARVVVTQTFVNLHDQPLEATYIFPLPDRAAVTHFRLEVAGRVIEGDLKERGAARREYDQAIAEGHQAAITEEERPGVFTMRVGNLPPGESATVRLTLTGPLPYGDGEATFRFPLVVAPRFIPGLLLPGPSVGTGTAADTDAVPDASRITPPVLLPGFPNPVALSLTVEVPPSSLAAYDFRSSLHTLIEEEGDRLRRFRLQPGERLDRDFILRFRLETERVGTSLCLEPDAGSSAEGTFLLTLVPPAPAAGARPRSREVVFVLDRSGSMSGWKMVAARRALARMVDTLTEHDRFTVLAFDDRIETPSEFENTLVPATDRQRFHAVEFLARVEARNGTEMAQPLDRGVRLLTEGGHHDGVERILVLVTDGQVGNEDQILRQLGARAKKIRIFTLGIDQAVNAAFLKRLADLGGGASALVESEDRLDEVMDAVHRHIGTPVLTGLRLEPAGLSFVPGSLVPTRLPDLFTGAPLMVLGRYRGTPEGAIAVQAPDAAGGMWSATVAVRRERAEGVGSVWARGRVRELEDRYVIGGGDRQALEREIVQTSLRFGVLCRFTAYVAVDRSAVVNPGGEVHQIVQPVEQPAGWENTTPTACSMATPCYIAPEASMGPVCLDYDAEAQPGAPPARKQSSLRLRGLAPAEDSVPIQARRTGWIGRLLRAFTRGRRASTFPEEVDRTPLQPRVLDLLQAMSPGAASDPAARLALLRSLASRFEQLFKDLVTAGDRHPSVQHLGEALVQLQALLTVAHPVDALVYEVWGHIEKSLRDWLTAVVPVGTPGPREGFWK